MEKRVVTELAAITAVDESQIVSEALRIILANSGDAVTVKAARDSFSKLLGRARAGDIQIVGRTTADMTVIMSIKDLAKLVAATQPLTFGSGLDDIGFKPLGRKIKIKMGVNHLKLKRNVGT